MNLAKLALLFVVFVDLVGQGVIIPVINALIMDPSAGFLASDTAVSTRHLYYGLVIGVFYLSWFLGAVYVSKLSDSIGRKNGILLCLLGALAGYALTVLAIATGSLWLMILGRAITGFTAGNQPIAQAAMVDLSRDDAEKTRNLGYIVTALSLGLVAGPLLAGGLTDPDLVGDLASLSLPFWVSGALVAVAALLILFGFEDKLAVRAPLTVRPAEVFLLLWQAARHPVVLRLGAVYILVMLIWNTNYVFIDNYLTSRFQVGTFQTSLVMAIFGLTLALASAFLVGALGPRLKKGTAVAGAIFVMALSAAAILLSPGTIPIYLALVPMAAAFAVGYATLLSLFSDSVDESQQGWVMGVSTALWTLGAGLTSLVGGDLMGWSIGAPFLLAIAAAILALILMATLWQSESVRRLAGQKSAQPAEQRRPR